MDDATSDKLQDLRCRLGFHKWKSMGKVMPAIGNRYYEIFECQLPTTKVVGLHFNLIDPFGSKQSAIGWLTTAL